MSSAVGMKGTFSISRPTPVPLLYTTRVLAPSPTTQSSIFGVASSDGSFALERSSARQNGRSSLLLLLLLSGDAIAVGGWRFIARGWTSPTRTTAWTSSPSCEDTKPPCTGCRTRPRPSAAETRSPRVRSIGPCGCGTRESRYHCGIRTCVPRRVRRITGTTGVGVDFQGSVRRRDVSRGTCAPSHLPSIQIQTPKRRPEPPSRRSRWPAREANPDAVAAAGAGGPSTGLLDVVAVLPGHRDAVFDVAWIRDGRGIVSAGR